MGGTNAARPGLPFTGRVAHTKPLYTAAANTKFAADCSTNGRNPMTEQPRPDESPGTPEWDDLGIPEDDTAEPDDAGHGDDDASDQ